MAGVTTIVQDGDKIYVRNGTYTLSGATPIDIVKPCTIEFENEFDELLSGESKLIISTNDITIINGIGFIIIYGDNVTLLNFKSSTEVDRDNIVVDGARARILNCLSNKITFNSNAEDCYAYGNRKHDGTITEYIDVGVGNTYEGQVLDYSAILTPYEGQQAWDGTAHKPVWYDGTKWVYSDGTEPTP